MHPDPVRLEVFHQLLASVCEEAGALLQRSAISPNIRERRDYSCALFDGDGQLIAQAAHIPVHLGSAGDSVAAARARLDLESGDVVILNDPYAGGTHLPDITMVRPVFDGRSKQPRFFVVCRAHHADVGGSAPGSMAVAHDLIAEGLVIPPVKLRRAGHLDQDLLRLLCANVRSPEERRIDLQAQEAALELAERRIMALCREHGAEQVRAYSRHLMDYSERLGRSLLSEIPRGKYTAVEHMEDDGMGFGPFALRLRLRVDSSHLDFDYRGSAKQARGGINANRSIVMAASIYAFRCLCPARLPTNEGLFRLLSIHTDPGSILDPTPGSPVAGGNVETSQRLVDLCLQAFAKALPKRIPASSAGTMSNFTIGASEPEPFASYETLPGGAGAGPGWAGSSVLQTHMTNTRNTPIEEAELVAPLRVTTLTVRRGSGGRGRHRGGDGLIKEIEVNQEVTISLFAERHRRGAPGLFGGHAGKPGKASVIRGGRSRRLQAKTTERLVPGDRVRIETPGGGGWGKP